LEGSSSDTYIAHICYYGFSSIRIFSQTLQPSLLFCHLSFFKEAMPRGHYCQEGCIFSTKTPMARFFMHGGTKEVCSLCDESGDLLRGEYNNVNKRKNLIARVRKIRQVHEPAAIEALRRIRIHLENDAWADIDAKSQLQPRVLQRRGVSAKAKAAAAGRPVLAIPPIRHAPWDELLGRRKLALQPLTEAEQADYTAAVTNERRLVGRKFFGTRSVQGPAPKRQRLRAKTRTEPALPYAPEDIAPNDTGLPGINKDFDPEAYYLERWCKSGSWKMCEECLSMHPQRLLPIDMRREAPTTLTAKACKHCRNNEWVPQPTDIPKVLRGLSRDVIEVLRPLEINTGQRQPEAASQEQPGIA
jgi:hypothetical protein